MPIDYNVWSEAVGRHVPYASLRNPAHISTRLVYAFVFFDACSPSTGEGDVRKYIIKRACCIVSELFTCPENWNYWSYVSRENGQGRRNYPFLFSRRILFCPAFLLFIDDVVRVKVEYVPGLNFLQSYLVLGEKFLVDFF